MLLEGMQNTDYENKVDYLYAAFDCLTDSMDALETVEAPPGHRVSVGLLSEQDGRNGRMHAISVSGVQL